MIAFVSLLAEQRGPPFWGVIVVVMGLVLVAARTLLYRQRLRRRAHRAEAESSTDSAQAKAVMTAHHHAVRLAAADQHTEVITYLTGVLHDYPEVIALRAIRGHSYLLIGSYREAIADFDWVLDRQPLVEQTREFRGFAKAQLGDLTGAIADYDQRLSQNPADVQTRYNRAVAYGRHGDYPAAIREYDEILRQVPQQVVVVWNRAQVKAFCGDHAGARADYTQVLALLANSTTPTHPPQVIYPRRFTQDSRPFTAGNEATQIFDLVTICQYRAFAALQIEEYSTAIRLYDEVLRLQPDDVGSYLCRGAAKQGSGDVDGALADYHQARTYDAHAAAAAYNIASIYAHHGNAEAAWPWIQMAITEERSYGPLAQTDSDFQVLHTDPRFLALIRQ